MAGVGWCIVKICAFQTGGGEKEAEFLDPEKGVEIAGDDDFFFRPLDKTVEMGQLVLAMSVLEGKVDQIDHRIGQFGGNDQAFHPFAEIMELMIVDFAFGQEGVGLLVEDRDS